MDQPSRWQAGKNKIKQRKMVSPLNSLEELAPNNKGSRTSLNGVICAHAPCTFRRGIHGYRAVHPYPPTRQSSEHTAACKPMTLATVLTNKDLLRQTHTEAVLLVWVIVFNIIDPQEQSHGPSSLLVLLWRKELQSRELLSPWISSTIYPDSLNSFSLLLTSFIMVPAKHTHSLPHTRNASTA